MFLKILFREKAYLEIQSKLKPVISPNPYERTSLPTLFAKCLTSLAQRRVTRFALTKRERFTSLMSLGITSLRPCHVRAIHFVRTKRALTSPVPCLKCIQSSVMCKRHVDRH